MKLLDENSKIQVNGIHSRREHVIAEVVNHMTDLLYYDRDEDEELPRGAIEQAIKDQEISIDEILEIVRYGLEHGI